MTSAEGTATDGEAQHHALRRGQIGSAGPVLIVPGRGRSVPTGHVPHRPRMGCELVRDMLARLAPDVVIGRRRAWR